MKTYIVILIDDGSQCMILCTNKENYLLIICVTPSYLELG